MVRDGVDGDRWEGGILSRMRFAREIAADVRSNEDVSSPHLSSMWT